MGRLITSPLIFNFIKKISKHLTPSMGWAVFSLFSVGLFVEEKVGGHGNFVIRFCGGGKR